MVRRGGGDDPPGAVRLVFVGEAAGVYAEGSIRELKATFDEGFEEAPRWIRRRATVS